MNRSLSQACMTFLLPPVIVLSLFSISLAAPQDGTRTWKSASGKFSIEASLEGRVGDTLILKGTNGKKIEVPLEKLSSADQTFVKELETKENPVESEKDGEGRDKPWTPVKDDVIEIQWGSSWYPGTILEVQGDDAFLIHYSKYDNDTWDEVVTRDRIRQPGTTATSPAAKPGAKPAAAAKPDPGAKFVLTPGDISTAKTVSIDNPAWKLDRITLPALSDLGKVKIKLPVAPERIGSSVFAMNKAQTMGFLGSRNGVKGETPQLLAFDLTAGKLFGTTELPIQKNHFRDTNADGSLLLSSSDTHWPERNRIDRWKIQANGKLEHLGGIELKTKVVNALFLANGNVMVQDIWGVVTVWDMELEESKAKFALPYMGTHASFDLSQDKKTLFGSTDKKIFAFDLTTGKCVGSIEHGLRPGPIAVTSDHSKVALALKNRILVWNNTGEEIADFYYPKQYRKVRWIDDRYLTAGNHVVDTKSGIILCELDMPWWFAIDGRTDYWMFDKETKNFGNAPAIMKEFESLIPENLKDNFVLKNGDTVAMDVEFAMPAKERKEVEASLRRQFEKLGVTVDNKSKTRIKISQKTTTQSKQYRDRFTGSISKVNAQRHERTISLVRGDLTLLSYSEIAGGLPNTIAAKGDETMQQAADRIRPELKYDFFANTSLPDDIAIHPDEGAFAKTTFAPLN